jgi:hypothetical protein
VTHHISKQGFCNNNNNKTTENCHIGHCAHTSESAKVKVHYRVNTGTSDMGTINSSDRIAATLYSLGTLFQEYMYKYPA